ncbi:MAG: PH domain-containing protein [Halobacteriaceae archaeon]
MDRLHPRIRVVWGLRSLVRAVLLAAVAGLLAYGLERVAAGAGAAGPPTSPLPPAATAVAVFVPFAALGLAFTVLRYRAWGYEVGEDTLVIERGVLTNVRTVVPYVRVQHVDTRRGPVARLLGLGRVVVYTAGSRGADVAVPGLAADRTAALQETLRRLAIESEPEAGDAGDAV